MAGKVVLVAGGTGGLGRAVSLAFVEDGARVIVTFQRSGDLDELKKAASAKLSEADSASLEGFAVDVTDEATVAKLIDGIIERHERLDCLVNAVGGYAGGIKLWEMETMVFEQICTGAGRGASDGKARKRSDCERGVEGGGGSLGRSSGVRGVEGRSIGDDRLPGGGLKRHGSARQLDTAEHH